MYGVGARLRMLRRAKGLTQRQVAGGAGVAPSTWACWEQGRRIPRLPGLERAGQALGVTASEILRDTEQEEAYTRNA